MKTEALKVDKLILHPLVNGEIVFVASSTPKEKSFKIELSDEAKLKKVRKELKEYGA